MTLLDTLLDWERRYWGAAGDHDFYRAHLAAEALFVFPAPFGIAGREATIDAVAQSQEWRGVELDEATATEPGDDVAAVAYRARAVRADGSGYEAYVASVYVRQDGEWKLAVHQQTPV